MNRFFYSGIVLLLSSALSLCSCSKYDDAELMEKAQNNILASTTNSDAINSNIKIIEDLNSFIQSGVVVKEVTEFTEGQGGYNIKLSNGNTVKILNGSNTQHVKDGKDGKDGEDGKDGKDGKNGSNEGVKSWRISTRDSLWYANGEKTSYRAIGCPGKDGESGYYYVPNKSSGMFDIYQDGAFVKTSDISWRYGLSAVVNGNYFTLHIPDVGTVTLPLGKAISSAVYDLNGATIDKYSPIISFSAQDTITLKYILNPSDAYWGDDFTVDISATKITTKAAGDIRQVTGLSVIPNSTKVQNGVLTVKAKYNAYSDYSVQYSTSTLHERVMLSLLIRHGTDVMTVSDGISADVDMSAIMHNGHAFVRLWEDGPKWALRNVTDDMSLNYEAESENDGTKSYGGYFRYADREPYINNWNNGNEGSEWRIASLDDWDQLEENCFLEIDTEKKCLKFTGKDEFADCCMYLPIAGYINSDGLLFEDGNTYVYWTSTEESFGTTYCVFGNIESYGNVFLNTLIGVNDFLYPFRLVFYDE